MARLPIHQVSIAICVSISGFGHAQTTAQYVSMRKQHHITQAVGPASLESFVGTRVLEVQGVVRGSFSVSGKTVYVLERPDGGDLWVESPKDVDWMSGNEVATRLLIRAHRPTESADLRAVLLGAAPEHEIRNIERRSKPPVPSRSAGTPRVDSYVSKPKSTSARNWSLPASEATPVYAQFIKSFNKRLTDAQAYEIAQGIIGFSIQYGVDARLIMAMVLVESGFNPNTTSRAGAMGLGQLMPGTAAEMGVSNAYDTMDNLYGTVRLVRKHIDKYTKTTGDDFEGLVLALAAYNAGPGAVKTHGGVPPYRETQNYVKKVIATYNAFLGK